MKSSTGRRYAVIKKKNLIVRGKPASKGSASGIARYIHSANDFDYGSRNFKKGDILLAPMTDIDFLPLMRKASAVLTSQGGRFCHAAVICNELKTPCVVGTGNKIDLMKLSGKEITVDGTTGEILEVEK
jgi:pyruvate,water dikinase